VFLNSLFRNTIFCYTVLGLWFSECTAQSSYLMLNRDIHGVYENHLISVETPFHTSIKPFISSEVNQFVPIDSVNHSLRSLYSFTKTDSGKTKLRFPARRKNTSYKDTQNPDGKYLRVVAGPLFSIQPGYDISNSKSLLETSVGGLVSADIGKKLSVSARYEAGNSGYRSHVDSAINANEVVPGEGYGHPTSTGYAYDNYGGYISYSPSQNFNFQLGQGKNFWGDGYRSLLLSDNTFSYPFLKVSTNIWKLKYINLYTMFDDVHSSEGVMSRFKKKYGAFHYLSWNATKRINISLFEAIIWQGEDSSGVRGYDVNYLNPIIFYRPVEFAQGSSDNALIGLSFKIKLANKLFTYGQIIIDEFFLKEIRAQSGWWANKQGFQLGFKAIDLFKLKGISFQSEFNYVRPFTYSHGLAMQNYSHYNQPLAHPLGANFYESVSFLRYQRNSWLIEGKAIYAVYGADSSGSNWGGNIFLDYLTPREQEFNNSVAQGVQTMLIYLNLRVAYLLVPSINLKIEAGVSQRMQRSAAYNRQSTFVYVGLRTSLSNIYHDF